MPSFVSSVLAALSAAALAALVGTPLAAPICVLATPMPMPLLNGDYRRYDVTIRTSREDLHLSSRRGLLGDVNANGLIGDIGLLNTYYTQANEHAQTMKSLAVKSASVQPGDAQFEQRCAAAASGFHTSLLGFRTLLDQLGREKGLANYDRNDALQTMLKNVVNSNKNFLDSVDVAVKNIPTLGPVLGPIVYEIKCILDDVLNAVENTADLILTELQPLLRGLISKAAQTSCRTGIEPLGICLLG